MDAKTLEALKASIAKWERNAEAETPDDFRIREYDCPLCWLFIDDHCVQCPVLKRTGERLCMGTPYIVAVSARYAWKTSGEDFAASAHAAARDEVAFLKSLLPEETP